MSPFLAAGLVYGMKVFRDCGPRRGGGEVAPGVVEVGGKVISGQPARWLAEGHPEPVRGVGGALLDRLLVAGSVRQDEPEACGLAGWRGGLLVREPLHG